jgi:hypothetical protein
VKFVDRGVRFLGPNMLKYFCDLAYALVLKRPKGIDFRLCSDIFVMVIVIFDAFGAQRFDAG